MKELTQEQLENNMRTLERLWEYRYVRLVDYAIRSNNWFKLFSFLCEFKEHCIELVKELVHGGLDNAKPVDEIDHRYNLKGDGEEGIYLVEGIVIRVARIKTKKNDNGSVGF